MITVANRLQTVEEYYFSKKLREVNALKASGKPIINLGIGSPDLMPPQRVIDAITESFNHPNVHQYQSYQGLPELREAMAKFYKTQFKVEVDPASEILPLMGSKEGILHISMAFLNPDIEFLITSSSTQKAMRKYPGPSKPLPGTTNTFCSFKTFTNSTSSEIGERGKR